MSLHVHGDVCHFVNVLHPQYFYRLLHASNGRNLSLIRQISSFLHVLRILYGFKLLFLSPPILEQRVSGMDFVRVSSFKLGLEFLDTLLLNVFRGFNGFLNDLQLWDFNVLGHLIDCLIASLEPTSTPDTVRSLSTHVLLLWSTESLDHETMSISSMKEMYFQSYSHSESLQNVPISVSV